MRSALRRAARSLRRSLGLSPMQRVLRDLERRGVELGSLDALEVFGETGAFHTLDYAERVKSLQVWEIDPRHEIPLRRNVPRASLRIGDSYEQVSHCDDRFDLVVVDNPLAVHGGHTEHFDLFPGIFRLVRSPAVLVLNVIPTAPPAARRRFPYLFGEEQLAARRAFYRTETPEDVPREAIEAAYRRLAAGAGVEIEWISWRRRHFVYYLVLGLVRFEPAAEPAITSS